LLHSSNHPMIDYTATEDADPIGKYLKHYAAIYDPVSGQLQVTEAKKMTVRASVRQQEPIQ
jgi:DNA-directed RNA polymerase I subunit RPA49